MPQNLQINYTYSHFSQIPRAVIEPILFGVLIFNVAGLRGGFTGLVGFCFVCILCANYANAYGKQSSKACKKYSVLCEI